MKKKASKQQAAAMLERLYQAIESTGYTLRRGKGLKTDVANFLGMSAQRTQNWGVRGVSKEGLIAAQKITGCSLRWLTTGEGKMKPESGTGAGETQQRYRSDYDGLLTLIEHMPKAARAMMLHYAKCLLALMEKEPELFADKKELSEWVKWTREYEA